MSTCRHWVDPRPQAPAVPPHPHRRRSPPQPEGWSSHHPSRSLTTYYSALPAERPPAEPPLPEAPAPAALVPAAPRPGVSPADAPIRLTPVRDAPPPAPPTPFVPPARLAVSIEALLVPSPRRMLPGRDVLPAGVVGAVSWLTSRRWSAINCWTRAPAAAIAARVGRSPGSATRLGRPKATVTGWRTLGNRRPLGSTRSVPTQATGSTGQPERRARYAIPCRTCRSPVASRDVDVSTCRWPTLRRVPSGKMPTTPPSASTASAVTSGSRSGTPRRTAIWPIFGRYHPTTPANASALMKNVAGRRI